MQLDAKGEVIAGLRVLSAGTVAHSARTSCLRDKSFLIQRSKYV
jgi:hypothetical protein